MENFDPTVRANPQRPVFSKCSWTCTQKKSVVLVLIWTILMTIWRSWSTYKNPKDTAPGKPPNIAGGNASANILAGPRKWAGYSFLCYRLHIMEGSFSQKVWELATCIPEGRVTTYGILAAAAGGGAMAARSITNILSKAPNQSAIPYHRIVYAGGKVWMTDECEDKRRKLFKTHTKTTPTRLHNQSVGIFILTSNRSSRRKTCWSSVFSVEFTSAISQASSRRVGGKKPNSLLMANNTRN